MESAYILYAVAALVVVISYYFISKKNIKPTKLDFDRDYLIREGNTSDLDAINEICCNVYYGNDYLPHSWIRFLKDKSYIIYGVEYKKTARIVSVQLIKIQDGGIKGTLFGSRTHKKHQRKGLMTRLQKFIKHKAKKIHPQLNVWESTTASSNDSSIKLQSKGLYLINNVKYIFAEISRQDVKSNAYVIMKNNEFNSRFNQISSNFDQYKNEYKYFENIDEVIKLLRNKFSRNNVLFDWKLFKLTGINDVDCIRDMKLYLQKEMKAKRLYFRINNAKTLLCMIGVDERGFCQFHFYNTKDIEPLELLTMIKCLYDEWDNNDNDIYGNKQSIRIYIDQWFVNENACLSKLFHGFDSVRVFNSNSAYYC